MVGRQVAPRWHQLAVCVAQTSPDPWARAVSCSLQVPHEQLNAVLGADGSTEVMAQE